MNSQDLAAKLEQVFAADELCQNVHATIYQNEIGIAHRVEYRFHTFGIELSEGPDGPDFCSSCGWNTEHIKCNAVPDDHPSEACHYLCANCGMNTGITTPCIRQITLNMEFKSEAFLTRSPNVVSAVSPDVVNAAGEILLGYALAENNLRAMMVNVPGHKPGSNLSADIERLKNARRQLQRQCRQNQPMVAKRWKSVSTPSSMRLPKPGQNGTRLPMANWCRWA